MNRKLLAALALLMIVGGVLTVVTGSAMRRNTAESAAVTKSWQVPDDSWKKTEWLKEYQLTDRSGKLFDSKSLAGSVHVASFFFASCPHTCYNQNKSMETLAEQFQGKPVKFLSISCNPEADTPDVLKEYARKFKAPADQWFFLTGDLTHIRRIGAEIYKAYVDKMHHLDRLIVVDKWGEVRGSFNWKEPEKMAECKWMIDKLMLEETRPEPAAVSPAPEASVKPTENDETTKEAKKENE